MIQHLSYPSAYQIAINQVCGNCGSELIITPTRPDQGEYGLVCSICREGLQQSIPAGASMPSIPMVSPRKMELFWSHVLLVRQTDSSLPDFDTCWYWTGSRDEHRKGYGFFRGEDRVYRANRYSYMISHPTGIGIYAGVAAHTCHQKSCVNFFHILNATSQENIQMNYLDDKLPHLKMNFSSVQQLNLDAQRGMKTKALAQKYKISEWMVRAILTGKCWSWVTGLPRAYHQYRASNQLEPIV